MTRFLTFLIAIALLLTACNIPTALQPGAPTAAPTASMTPTATVQAAIQTPESKITVLHIWVPPLFDPESDTPAAKLFKERLEEFTKRRPETKIEVRVKALEGPGGLLDSLSTANAAAPLSVPDLVALPRNIMETAAIKGLLHPFDGLTEIMDDPDWYGYTRQLALLQNSTFGIPFAGDALVLVYRTSAIEQPPSSWADALEAPKPLVFPAADPQALLTLTFYQAAGGVLLDENERPTLDPKKLTPILTYYQQALVSGLIPYWVTQYESDEQSWQAFEQKQTDMVITWVSRYLANTPANSALSQIPSGDGTAVTTATGWVWALSTPDSNRHELATQLAEFITAGDFLGEWSSAAGFPPVRPSSLEKWKKTPEHSLLGKILPSAKLIPPQDILNTVGPKVRDATVSILKDKADPETAAQTASDALKNPQ